MTLFDLIKDPYYKHKYVLERICMELLWFERSELILHYDDVIDTTELLPKIKQLYDEYAIGKQPLEYILWYVEYGWLRFHVNKNTIIPRPETEYMIEAVREYLDWKAEEQKSQKAKKITTIWAFELLSLWALLVDVGTGSGVLWLSILHSHGSQIESAFLIDISEGALEVAQKNYKHCLTEWQIDSSIDVVIEKGNLFSSPLLESYLWSSPTLLAKEGEPQEIIILANLPYIPDETFDTNPDQSIKFEPRVAFVGGDDGLDLYRVMFGQISGRAEELKSWKVEELENWQSFKPLSLWAFEPSIVMFLEMMTWQVDILRKEFDWLEFEEIKTFHFQIRIVKVVLL